MEAAGDGGAHGVPSEVVVRRSKDGDGASVATRVEPLDEPARREEIARMLAGAEITDEARAAAERLLGGDASVAAASPRDAA